jgi:cell division septum initiation protein DivIVA
MTDAPGGPDGPGRPDGPDDPRGSGTADGSDEEYYPEFRTVRRGYDPDEVEQVLDDLYASLSDAVRDAEDHARRRVAAERDLVALRTALAQVQRRVAELESRPVADAEPFEGVGARVGAILRAAAAEASEIVRRAEEQAEAVTREAERLTAELAERRKQVDAEIEQLRNDARAEAASLRSEALDHRARVRTQLAEVRERLTSALEDGAAPVEDGVRD